MEPKSNREQKCALLLSKEENDSILQLMGSKCQSLSMAVVQFFSADASSDYIEWQYKYFGVLSFVRDANRKSYYFRLFCPVRHQLLWEHEMYNEFQYQSPAKYFHCFEAEECIVGFNLASEDEASTFEETVIKLQKRKQGKQLENISTSHNYQSHTSLPSVPNNKYELPDNVKRTKKKEKSINKKYSKNQIGSPQNFIHVQHIGRLDPHKEFDLELINIEDPRLNKFYAKAGVSERQLRNLKTRSFICDFIHKHGVMDVIKVDIQASPPPSPLSKTTLTPLAKQQEDFVIPPPPPLISSPAPRQIELEDNKPVEPISDTRSALLDAIKSGKTLKPVNTSISEETSNPATLNSRDALLDQIKQGKKLKKFHSVKKKISKNIETDTLAGALRKALSEQAKYLQSSSSCSSNDSSGDETDNWDD